MSRRLTKDERGVSLMELLIGMGLAGGMALGVGVLMSHMAKVMQYTATSTGFVDLQSIVRTALDDWNLCAQRLKPASGGDSGFGIVSEFPAKTVVPAKVTSVAKYSSSAPDKALIVKHDALVNQVKMTVHLTDFQFTGSLPPLGNANPRFAYNAVLKVTGVRKTVAGVKRLGAGSAGFTIPMKLEFDSAGTLRGCSTVAPELNQVLLANPASALPKTFSQCRDIYGIPIRLNEGPICKVFDPDHLPGAPAGSFKRGPVLNDCPDGWSRFREWSAKDGGDFTDSDKSPPFTSLGCY